MTRLYKTRPTDKCIFSLREGDYDTDLKLALSTSSPDENCFLQPVTNEARARVITRPVKINGPDLLIQEGSAWHSSVSQSKSRQRFSRTAITLHNCVKSPDDLNKQATYLSQSL